MANGLFTDPREVLAQQAQEDALFGQLRAQGAPRLIAPLLFGQGRGAQQLRRGIGGLFGGQDPRMDRARRLQEAQQELIESGLDVNDPRFLPAAASALQRRGLTQEALKLQEVAGERGLTQARTGLAQAQTLAALQPEGPEIRTVGNRVIQIMPNGQTRVIFEGDPDKSFQSRVAIGPNGETMNAVFDPDTGRSAVVKNGRLEPVPEGFNVVSATVSATETSPFTRFGRPSANLVSELSARQDLFNEGIALIDRFLSEPESVAGIVGSLRRGAQTTGGVLRDLASAFPGVGDEAQSLIDNGIRMADRMTAAGDLDAGAKNELFNETVSSIDLIENSLGLLLARSRVDTGRIPVEVIRRSINDVQLTGLRGSGQVKNRLNFIKRQFERRATSNRNRLRALQRGEAPREQEPDRQGIPTFRLNPDTNQLEQTN